jgi:hypothetical protein
LQKIWTRSADHHPGQRLLERPHSKRPERRTHSITNHDRSKATCTKGGNQRRQLTNGLYAAGLLVRDIQAHLEDLYGLRVSPDLISRVTDAVLDEVREWQQRALDRMYPIVIFDALRVKIRDADSRMVKNKAVNIALGVTRKGIARFWASGSPTVGGVTKQSSGLFCPTMAPSSGYRS